VSLLDHFKAAGVSHGESMGLVDAFLPRRRKWSQRRQDLEARAKAAKAGRRRRNREASAMRARQRRLA
jgi:hypothetical protein